MTDLTKDEQQHVRTALRFLRTRTGGWEAVAKALGTTAPSLADAMNGRRRISASIAFRVARLAGVSIDGLLRGEYPAPGTCPYCGHCPNVPAEGEETH